MSTPGRNSGSVPVALLTNNDPFLVERPHRAGRVLLCAVPLHNAWRTNLTDLPAFAPLAHELVYYLAGARAADNNLQPGQPLRYQLERNESLEGLTLQSPDAAEPKPLTFDGVDQDGVLKAQVVSQPQGPLVVYEGTREVGAYRLKTPDNRTVYYVAQPDPRESDLTGCTETDREKVAKLVPMTYANEPDDMTAQMASVNDQQQLWWCFLIGVTALLCGEVWMTRRIVRRQMV